MGAFILFEGVEGSGKSTQSMSLQRRLTKSGYSSILTSDPRGTQVGCSIDKLVKHMPDITINPLTELLLFGASHAQLVTEIIRPALATNSILICDRFTPSTIAYQGYGRGLDMETIEKVNATSTGGLSPDLVILLDLDAEEGIRRKESTAAKDRFEQEEMAFHNRVREGYLKLAEYDPQRWLIIDASQPKPVLEDVIWLKVQQFLI